MKPLVFLSDEVSLLRARSEVLFLKRAEKREAAWTVRALHSADSYVCKSKFGATSVKLELRAGGCMTTPLPSAKPWAL